MGMTIEEAIKELIDASHREVRYGDKDNHYDKVMKRVEAFDMAIKRLEELLEIHDNCKKCIEFSNFEPQPCEDCISREDLIATMHLIMDDAVIGDNDEDYECLEDVKQQYLAIAEGLSGFRLLENKWSSIGSNTDLETVPTNLQDWLLTFNTESATECFTAVQQLKEKTNE